MNIVMFFRSVIIHYLLELDVINTDETTHDCDKSVSEIAYIMWCTKSMCGPLEYQTWFIIIYGCLGNIIDKGIQ